jgi:transposase
MLSPVLPNRLKNPEQENPHMNISHYIGFDVLKKSVSYCRKNADGKIVEEGKLPATHRALRECAGKRSEAWRHGSNSVQWLDVRYAKAVAAKLQMGNPSRMKAIAAAKKKNDRLEARKIADLGRCNRSQRAM